MMVSIRRRRNLGLPTGSHVVEPPLPEGWSHAHHVKPDGELVKCYTNAIGQKFFNMEDLMRYVDARREQLSIYQDGFDSSQLADTGSEDEGFSLDSSKEQEKRNEHNKTSAADPTVDSKPKKQVGGVSGRKKARFSPKIPSHVDDKVDECATSSEKEKCNATSSASTPAPLSASRRLAGCGPEIVPGKPSQLEIKDDLIGSVDQRDKLASNE